MKHTFLKLIYHFDNLIISPHYYVLLSVHHLGEDVANPLPEPPTRQLV